VFRDSDYAQHIGTEKNIWKQRDDESEVHIQEPAGDLRQKQRGEEVGVDGQQHIRGEDDDRQREEDVFATALDPTASPKHATWREKLSQDLREPALKTPFFEAYVRRLRRVYSALLLILLAAWVARITVFTPGKGVLESAAMIGIPGSRVIVAVRIIYLIILGITFWPIDRKAKGEFYDREKEGEWKS